MTLVLIVEDDDKIRAGLLFQLRADGFAPQAVRTAEEAQARLAGDEPPPDLLLLDIRLPGMSGVELIRRLAPRGALPPTVVLSGEASLAEAVEALRLGVHDFVEKPFTRERLLQSMRNALAHAALTRKVVALESRLEQEPAILGESAPIARLREAIARAAPTDARVLILGASGTGKELVASALHRGSPRRAGPLVKINCAAIPPHLVEGELFGHARGAFTDARAPKAGLFEEAHGGTLFLDEIGDMEPALQGRLLRVLEDGRVRRLGETRDRQVDVRVVAATHQDLEARIAAGTFRRDLYFRLATLPIDVPTLAARREDVPLLVHYWLERFAARHGLRHKRVADEVLAVLEAYPWPGNVRELRNLCERLTIFASDPVTVDQLPAVFLQPTTSPAGAESGILRLVETAQILPWREFKAASEREYLETVLRRTGWNFAAAARLLDLQRTYLHQKAAALGLERPGRGGADENG